MALKTAPARYLFIKSSKVVSSCGANILHFESLGAGLVGRTPPSRTCRWT